MKSRNYFKYIIICFFILFIILYITNSFGYSEYLVHNKVSLTLENIEKFEDDIASGKDVSASDYIDYNYNDYSNKFSCAGEYISSLINKMMNFILKDMLKILKKLFYEN